MMKPFNVYPLQDLHPVKAKGCFIWDHDGKKYLDFYGGHGVISIGHGNEQFVQAIGDQLTHLAFYSNSVKNPLQTTLAESIGNVSGYVDYQLFMVSSGAEAVENALRLASFHTKRKKIISFEGAFHGRTSGSLSVTDNPSIRSLFNVDHEVEFMPLNAHEMISKRLMENDVAAVIVEGIQGINGVVEPEIGFLQLLMKVCKDHGTMLILDEIQSGFGRTGKFFAHQHAGIQPDLITVAKGMGNGFPVGAVMIHPDIVPKYGMLGTTFGGGHLACRAVSTVLEVMEKEGLIENSFRMGKYLLGRLHEIKQIKEIRGKGLMVGILFDFPVKILREKLLQEGILTGNSTNPAVLRLLPPLCVTREQIDTVIHEFKFVLKNLKSEEFSISS